MISQIIKINFQVRKETLFDSFNFSLKIDNFYNNIVLTN